MNLKKKKIQMQKPKAIPQKNPMQTQKVILQKKQILKKKPKLNKQIHIQLTNPLTVTTNRNRITTLIQKNFTQNLKMILRTLKVKSPILILPHNKKKPLNNLMRQKQNLMKNQQMNRHIPLKKPLKN